MDICVRPRRAAAMNDGNVGMCGVTGVFQTISNALLHRFTGMFDLDHV
jgi:hypothetical protein